MGYFDNNEKTEEKRNEAMMQYGLGIVDNADAYVEEYLEESLREAAASGKKYIDNNIKTIDGKPVTCCPPEITSYSGTYVAWLISEKNMSIDDALKAADPENPEAQELASQFNTFLMGRSLVMNSKGELSTYEVETNSFVTPDRANDMKAIFAKASRKLVDYKLPEIDYTDPKAVKENAVNLAFLKALGKEIKSQVDVPASDPYKISYENKKFREAYYDAIKRDIVFDPEIRFNGEYETDNYKKTVDKIEKTVDGLDKVMRSLNSCYGRNTWTQFPEELLAERHILNGIAGKPILAAEKELKDIFDHKRDVAKIMNHEFGISEKRIDDRLKGAEDPKLDEALKTSVSMNAGTLRAKVQARIKKVDKDGYRKSYLKNQSKENVDTDFKMMAELKSEYIGAEIDRVLKENKKKPKEERLDENAVMMLNQMKNSIGAIRKLAQEAETKGDYYMFRGSKVIKDTYFPMHGTSYAGEDSLDDKDLSTYRGMQESLGELVQAIDSMDLQGDTYPEDIKKIKEQAESVASADGHFIESLLDHQVTSISLPQAKKMYSLAYPTYKNDRMKLKSILEDKDIMNDKRKGETLSMDDLKDADNKIAASYESHKRESDQFDIQVNVKKFIERTQDKIKGSDDMTYDQFTDILAARASINAKRKNKKGLDKEASSIKIAKLKEDIEHSHLIRQFYADAKNDPKKWAELINSAKKGHAGELEDKIKAYSNDVPIKYISADPVNERFITTPKERIEAWQNKLKNDPTISVAKVASEILIMRNIAEAKAGTKSSLDKPITTQMLEEAKKQDKVIRSNRDVIQMSSDMDPVTRDKVLFDGHGGKLMEYLRFMGESYKYNAHPETREILEQNTIIGKYNMIDKEIKACEKATKEIYQQVLDNKMNKAEFDRQINDYFPRLVAESVIASGIIDNIKATDVKQEGLRVDMDHKDFEKKVNDLMATDEFKANYKTMMTLKNMPKKFDAKTMSEKYRAASEENQAAAEKAKQRQSFQMELTEKVKNMGPK